MHFIFNIFGSILVDTLVPFKYFNHSALYLKVLGKLTCISNTVIFGSFSLIFFLHYFSHLPIIAQFDQIVYLPFLRLVSLTHHCCFCGIFWVELGGQRSKLVCYVIRKKMLLPPSRFLFRPEALVPSVAGSVGSWHLTSEFLHPWELSEAKGSCLSKVMSQSRTA